jgi:outer membrane protein assembly factor BamB
VRARRGARFLGAACALGAAAAACLAAANAGGAVHDPGWTTWGDGANRQSRASSTHLTAATARHLAKAWARPLGGAGSAQPLLLRDIDVRGTRRDVYLAAGERGRVTAFAAATGRTLWSRELGSLDTGCAEMPDDTFGITGTPVFDPATGFAYVADQDRLWALDVRTGASRPGWPVTLPLDAAHEHVWGALTLAGGHVYLGTASFCDRRPYRGRVLSVATATGAVDHSWTTVETADAAPAGGGIWGWAGVAVTADGQVWAATSNANSDETDDQSLGNAQTVDELSPGLALLATGRAPGMPAKGDLGFGSTPVVFSPKRCPALVAAEGKDGALYVWRRAALADGPVQRLVLAGQGTLYGSPAWDPRTQRLFLTTNRGDGGAPPGLSALGLTADCQFERLWTKPLGDDLSSVPTVANDTVVVGTGGGDLRVYATGSGRLLLRAKLRGPVYAAPLVAGRDVAVTTWSNELVVFRLPPRG